MHEKEIHTADTSDKASVGARRLVDHAITMVWNLIYT